MNKRWWLLAALLSATAHGWTQVKPLPAAPQSATPQFDRDAFTITRWELNIAVDPELGTLGARGKVQLRNDSNAAQDFTGLQISSALRWSFIRSGETPLEFSSAKVVSDIDHTGSVNEAVVQLPRPIAPGGSIELEIGYAGHISQNATRLERLGTPSDVARRSDWDRISGSFTGVRGVGNVAWYPVSIQPALLGVGNRLFELLGKWKARHADSSFHAVYSTLRDLTVVANGSQLVSNTAGGDKPVSIESNLGRLGTETPFFIAAKYKSIETPKGRVFYFPSNEQIARKYADVLQALEPPFASKLSSSSARKFASTNPPLSRDVTQAGSKKETPVALMELPGDLGNFESGPSLMLPLRDLSEPQIQQLLIHTVAHGAFYSRRAWIYEGLAHYAQARLLEEQRDRKAALSFLDERRGGVVLAESGDPGNSSFPQNLVTSTDEVFYRSKAMFVWWMLHDMIGEQALNQALAEYKPEEDREPSYIQHLLESASGHNLEWFFDDWVYRDRGLPDFRITSVYPRQNLNGGYVVTVSVENLGTAGAEVPVSIRTREGEISTRLELMGKDKASARIPVHDFPLEANVNDGSVPESDTNNNSFTVPPPP